MQNLRKGVKFAAIDYLLKPVNIEERKTAVAKVMEKLFRKNQNLQMENLLALINHNDEKKDHRLALANTKKVRFVNQSQIVRCESSSAYPNFYLHDGDNIMVSKPIFE